ncbi:NAD(P)/FAD-dependent oxidoreductase [Mesorhizobium sp. M3A.F.Ca.ET.201.01.1.1]|uniref:phytoene desaturase family protein n=1 Tax=Mesorhizobium sp. M3A.F.Ca.ET.201.01.1.1 TaxID=2563946 RepID=UPI0010939711|nr:NAD(P)/FAD-dependent oxidoreductase [Mesorhizobium sp. M3A.F.Ca.ET.201.01.1.1]TGS71762.1 NAD(P)/FAD-dependent oxidoreductase [Mesorhizobium sp. M3A.F.Ca.ET.201.01.1.1]
MRVKQAYDAIVVGGGHNGLVAAGYLARAGKKVAVFERRKVLGGACVTEDFFPGVSFSSCSFIQAVLRPQIIRDLELSKFGLEMYAPDPQMFAVFDDATHVFAWQDVDKTLSEFARHSKEDAKNFLLFGTRLRRFGEIADRWLMTDPPSRATFIKAFEDEGEEELLNEFFFASTKDLLSRYFKSPQVRGYLTFYGIVSIWGGPSTPGTGYLFGYHSSGEFENTFGRWAFPVGGMGSITQAMARSAQAHGADIHVSSDVDEILVSDGVARGVRLADGREFAAPVILSNADPKHTFLKLLRPGAVGASLRKKVEQVDTRGSMARLHLLIDQLPQYLGFPNAEPGPQHRGHQLLGCSEERFEDAYSSMLRGELPSDYAIEAIIQSVTDPTLAPSGRHAMMLGVQNLSMTLAEGDWDSRREEFQAGVMESLYRYAPNLRGHVLGCHVITPLDLERTYGITGGNIFHTAMSVEHMFSARPIPEMGTYNTPVKGLYLCGAGSHPGGGVSGAPGHNAAQAVLADLSGAKRQAPIAATKGTSANMITRMMQSERGLSLGYTFARNRVFRTFSRLAMRNRR